LGIVGDFFFVFLLLFFCLTMECETWFISEEAAISRYGKQWQMGLAFWQRRAEQNVIEGM
jgi:hypothetical protein